MIQPHTTVREGTEDSVPVPPHPTFPSPPHNHNMTGTEVPFASVQHCARTALLCAQCTLPTCCLLSCCVTPHSGSRQGSCLVCIVRGAASVGTLLQTTHSWSAFESLPYLPIVPLPPTGQAACLQLW
eukprot:TRINITY_DN1390_c0_g2_i2.p1 TRINITY_DN1390_c0_g2~~TRINITY_DN1390_c0_g2_i2.p1  ORF type:complete len:127 (+),score=11.11 TRINITY_DN1390_c0_g2_i2:243-623(+)